MTDIEVTSGKVEATRGSSFVVVDIGKKQRKKAIKGLRKGKGKLTRKIEAMLADLKDTADGPVVVVVREKRKRLRGPFGKL